MIDDTAKPSSHMTGFREQHGGVEGNFPHWFHRNMAAGNNCIQFFPAFSADNANDLQASQSITQRLLSGRPQS